MSDNPFRVLLDVTELYIDNLKYVWVNVSPVQLKTISDFKASIREKLNLGNRDIKIFVREGLLLDEETITVLRENDTVKVQYNDLCASAAKSLTKEQKKYLKKRNYSECTDDVIMDTKKCKNDNISKEIDDTVDGGKRPKKSRTSLSTGNIISHSESLEGSTYTAVEKYEKKAKKDIKITENYGGSCNMDQTLEDSVNSHYVNVEENNSAVIKKQKKKNKEKSDISEMTIDDGNTNNDIFLSFSNVDSTVNQLENISSSAINVDSDTFTKDLSKSSQNSNDISEVGVNISAETSRNNQKKKRKRRRKRKSTVSADIDACQNVDAESFVSFSNDVEECKIEQKLDFVAPKVSQNPDARSKSVSFSNNEETVKRKHIVYSPVPCEAEKKPVEIHNNMRETHNSSNNTYVVNEDVSNVNAQSFKNYPKVSTPNQPNKCKNLSWHVSLMQSTHSMTNNEPQISEKDSFKKEKSNIECEDLPPLNSFPKIGSHIMHKSDSQISEEKEIKFIVDKIQSYMKSNSYKKEKSNIKCEDLPPLNSFPEIGTRIMYKILELDDCYSPVVSEYREGLVKSVNHDTQEIEIELLKEVVKPGRTGKFENLKEDESPSPEIIRCDTVPWSSLISPKRMY